MWFLPSLGILARIYWYYKYGNKASISDAIPNGSRRQSCWEAVGNSLGGVVDFNNGGRGYWNEVKFVSIPVRPVCAF